MIKKETYRAIEEIIEEIFNQADQMILSGGSTPTGIYVPWEPLFLPRGGSVCELKQKLSNKIKKLMEEE